MKKIMYDLYGAQQPNRKSGGNEYMYTVLKKLIEYHGKDIEIIPCYDFDNGMEEWIEDMLSEHGIKARDVKSRKEMIDICADEGIDVFYSGLPYVYYDVKKNGTKFVGTFHGLRNYERSNDMLTYINSGSRFQMFEKHVAPYALIKKKMTMRSDSMKQEYIKSIRNFDTVITVSNHSKYALKALYGETV
jgi:hypothetical protein